MGFRVAAALLIAVLSVSAGRAATVSVAVDPTEATVGEQLDVVLRIEGLPADGFVPPEIGPEVGPFSVIEGAWTAPREADDPPVWVWKGKIAAYKTGEQQLPPLRFEVGGERISSEPVSVTIASVLEGEEAAGEPPEIADIKEPLSVAPDFRPLLLAAGLLVLFLVLAGLAWWLQRRYGSRLAAVAVPDDPFHRVPPHEWIYSELKLLLARHLAERGEVDLFYAELSRLLKRYLSGRYRVELMEQTTEEVPALLRQSAAPARAVDAVAALLREADRVKFAAERPGSSAWKGAVEQVYAIVDQTRPAETPAAADAGGG